MRLLASVERWDRNTISCRATSHHASGNPLRCAEQLPAIAGLEYAAQAMGVHVGLTNRDKETNRSIGYVGAVRNVVLAVERLDNLPGDLHIEAWRLVDGQDSFMYQFTLSAGNREIMSGRASIFVSRIAA